MVTIRTAIKHLIHRGLTTRDLWPAPSCSGFVPVSGAPTLLFKFYPKAIDIVFYLLYIYPTNR